MVSDDSKVTIHMAASLDGYVASKDEDYSWLECKGHYEKGIELSKQEISDFLDGIGCYLIGAKTYEMALKLGWPYADKPTAVLTNRSLHSDRENVTFLSGDLAEIIQQKLKPQYGHIWMGGGPSIAREILDQGLADELIVTIVPVLLGSGTPFFKPAETSQSLHLIDSKTYTNGMVELTYELLANNL